MNKFPLELLSPAKNKEIARQAVLHGADAVYIGASTHGARKAASNSLDDIAETVDFAHDFRAKVYVTVNTIIFEEELGKIKELCRDLYHIGVDALIVQDMGMLRLDLPPIALHASTQCDIRTPEKAVFLEKVGFSQLVLARELSLSEISEITHEVKIPIECFIHGALCVSYSGRCHASHLLKNRSANRGDCAQICRLPFTLKDADGKILAKDKHLLSLKDFRADSHLKELIDIGVSSFKIEGRLKDEKYVKNVTAYYNNVLSKIIKDSKGELKRSSYGNTFISFNPNVEKSFNRGFTDYSLGSHLPKNIASINTPKSMGEVVRDIKLLNNGDGISFFDKEGNYTGVNVNKVVGNTIIPGKSIQIPKNAVIYRTNDIKWEKELSGQTSWRKLDINIELDEKGVNASDEIGNKIRIPLNFVPQKSDRDNDYKKEFNKLGNTIYSLSSFKSLLSSKTFIPLSIISSLRREVIKQLKVSNKATYKFEYRRKEDLNAIYPLRELDYKENVSNSLAARFYKSHGVEKIEPAVESDKRKREEKTVVMTTRHCVLRELGLCKKTNNRKEIKYPLTLIHGNEKLHLQFDCRRCEMEISL